MERDNSDMSTAKQRRKALGSTEKVDLPALLRLSENEILTLQHPARRGSIPRRKTRLSRRWSGCRRCDDALRRAVADSRSAAAEGAGRGRASGGGRMAAWG